MAVQAIATMQQILVRGGHLDVEVTEPARPGLGDAATVILHHGIGTDMGIWSGWLPGLASAFRIVRFNMRGFGRSSPPAADGALCIDDFSDDVMAVADATGTAHFHLVAESFGGMVSLNTAIRHPARVRSATLLSTPHRGADIVPLHQWPSLSQSEAGMRQWNDEMMAGRFAPGSIDAAASAWFRKVQERTPAAVLHTLARLIARTDLSADLARLRAPVLLISGDASPYVGVAQVAALQALLPQARVQILEGARHGIAFSHAAQGGRAFRSFIDSTFSIHPTPSHQETPS